MNFYSSPQDKYDANYWQWLCAYFMWHITLMYSYRKEILDGLDILFTIILWVLTVLTLPISIPSLALFMMIRQKRAILREYGKEALTRNREESG